MHSLTYRHSLPSSVGPCSSTGPAGPLGTLAPPDTASRTAATMRGTSTGAPVEVIGGAFPLIRAARRVSRRAPGQAGVRGRSTARYWSRLPKNQLYIGG